MAKKTATKRDAEKERRLHAEFDQWCISRACADFCVGRENYCELADEMKSKNVGYTPDMCERLWREKMEGV